MSEDLRLAPGVRRLYRGRGDAPLVQISRRRTLVGGGLLLCAALVPSSRAAAQTRPHARKPEFQTAEAARLEAAVEAVASPNVEQRPAAAVPPDLPDYLALVVRYRQGEREATITERLRWPKALGRRLRSALDGSGAPPCDPVCLRAAGLLETEAARRQLEESRGANVAFHLDLARRFVEAARDSPGGERFLRDWLLAAGQLLRQFERPQRALDYFRDCAQRFRDDAGCQLGLAATHEDLVSRGSGGDWGWLAGPTRDPAALRVEACYRRALELAPALDEAHLRYGRFCQRQARRDEARRHLTQALEGASSIRTRVLAHLFLGQMDEGQGRLETAASHYRAALAEEPNCQAARLALSQTLRRAGQLRAATEAARAALEAGNDPQAVDSWLVHRFDAAAAFNTTLAELQERVRP